MTCLNTVFIPVNVTTIPQLDLSGSKQICSAIFVNSEGFETLIYKLKWEKKHCYNDAAVKVEKEPVILDGFHKNVVEEQGLEWQRRCLWPCTCRYN